MLLHALRNHRQKPWPTDPQSGAVLGDRAFREASRFERGHEGESQSNKKMKRHQTARGQSKKMAVCKPEGEASGETNRSHALTLDLQPPDCGRMSAG